MCVKPKALFALILGVLPVQNFCSRILLMDVTVQTRAVRSLSRVPRAHSIGGKYDSFCVLNKLLRHFS